MSTNINEDSLPNLQELEKLANRFFKNVPGSPDHTLQSHPAKEYNPVGDQLSGIPGTDGFPIDLSDKNPQPPSLSGFGASPSAINQGSVVNIKDPQTSFDDPVLLSSQPSAGNKIPALPFSGSQLSSHNFNQLPYQQQEQSFDKELQDILNKINTAVPDSQIPFKPDYQVITPSYYFLKAIPVQLSVPGSSGASSIVTPPFDVNIIRQDFPILKENVNGKQLVWLDNAATTQKPKQVIDRISYFYEH
jgi:cysteine desulfurase / selenocysteine lyase